MIALYEAIIFEWKRSADGGYVLHAQKPWPDNTVIDDDIIRSMRARTLLRACRQEDVVRFDGDDVIFSVANGWARYRRTSRDACGRSVCVKVSSMWDYEFISSQ